MANSFNFCNALLVAFILLLDLSSSKALTRPDNNTDQESLLSFKSRVNNDPFGVLDTWNANTPFCNWSGVICNITKQRVTSLNLGSLSLSGTISPYLANLSFLSVLDLQNNSFYGSLPSEFGRLFRLQFLFLSSNLIEGTIPSSMSLCTRLVTVDLMKNRFQGSIPTELGNLPLLQALGLSENFLTGRIPSSLRNLSSLTNLLMSENFLHGSIPEELGHLPSLIHLQIDQSNLTGEIPPSLLNRSSLIMLTLALNNLTGSLPSDMFSKLTSLTTLYVGGNNLSGPIPPSIANASSLERLDFSYNSFSGQIPLLLNMPNIQVLNLGINQLTSDGENGMDFITSLANSPKLRVFTLSDNRLTGKLPSSIGNLSKVLSQLVMTSNHLEGSIPLELGRLVGLGILALEENAFTGNIPSSLGELIILQNLYLNQNKLSGNIPQSLGNLTLLSEMRLSGNNLSGTIPASLGNFQHLNALDLAENKLSGPIPREIFEIPSLGKVLNLSSNSLTGPIPVDIGKLKMVQGIDFSVNKLSGNIPESIGDCSNLVVLDLSRNSFQGPIPNSLSRLKGIEYIDLSVNNLSGQIPTSLQSLQFLQLLNLSMNQLEGEVPKKGIFTNSTAVSLKGNRNFCGGEPLLGFPSCIVPRNSNHSTGSKVKLIVGVIAGFVAFCVLLALILIFSCKRNAGRSKVEKDCTISFDGSHRLYTRHDLRNATNNFSSENLIGEGSFGRVYKGILRDGTVAAIKVFNMNQHGALKSFISECEVLRNIRHRNLVRIMSACSTGDFKALVLPFMNNGSLDIWLHNTNRSWLDLNLMRRLEIAIDVAFAVEYLHHDCETPIVHCDLKPSNILLDKEMTAHVADFGIARMLLNHLKQDSVSSTLGLRGSIGYIPPEYGMAVGVSPEGDVYSYGILLLEMFSGKKPTDEMFVGELNLQKWVSMALPDRIIDLVNPEYFEKDELFGRVLVSVINVGLTCAETLPEDRPTMREVSSLIRSVRDELLTY